MTRRVVTLNSHEKLAPRIQVRMERLKVSDPEFHEELEQFIRSLRMEAAARRVQLRRVEAELEAVRRHV